MTPEEQFGEIRATLAAAAQRLSDHASMIVSQDERIERIGQKLEQQIAQHTEDIAQIRATLTEAAQIQRDTSKQLLTHAKLLAEHDERLERIGRHLEVLIDIVDGMIRKGK